MSSFRRAARSLLVAAALAAAVGIGCSSDDDDKAPPAPPRDEASPTGGEPDSFSARLVRRMESGRASSTYEALVARHGALSREEWVETAGRRVVIARPDRDLVYVVDLDANEFTERPLGARPAATDALGAEEIEEVFPEAGAGSVVTRERVGTETVAGQVCTVYRSRIASASGSVSEATVWEADGLGGLAVKSELRHDDGPRFVTELVDIKVPADPALFEPPAGARSVPELRGR